MFRIEVHNSAPERIKKLDFWCNFLVGTHWRKPSDHAEIVIERVDKVGLYPMRLECVCKAFNAKYNVWGTQIRDFPVGHSFLGDRVDIEDLAKYGFVLVPDTILSRDSWYGRDDKYVSGLNVCDRSDPSLRRVDTAYELNGISGSGRPDEPAVLFSHGIPQGRVVKVKGILIGNGTTHGWEYHDIM